MNKKMLVKSLVGLVLAAAVIPMFLYGGMAVQILVLAAVLLAAYEIASLPDQKPHWVMTLFLGAAIELMGHMPDTQFACAAALFLSILIVICLFHEPFVIDSAVYTYFISMILVLAMQAISRVYVSGLGGTVILYVGFACFICDTGAYFFGSFMGKHKMIPRVSPNKTWEGFVGGYLAGLAVSYVFGRYFCPALPGSLLLAGSIVLPAVGAVGDLAFSLIKRRYGIKDYGSLLPGHGGVLDRIDSLLFCLMVFNAMLIFWGF